MITRYVVLAAALLWGNWAQLAGQEATLAKFDPAYRLPDAVRVHRDLVYATHEGRDLRLDLFEPRATEDAMPVILFVQGSGYNGNNKVHWWREAAHFASLGFVTICIEHRGLNRDNAKWPDQLADGQQALDWLEEHGQRYNLDPNRLALVGASSGGHIAAMLGLEPSNEGVRAVVTVNGLLDPVSFGTDAIRSREYQMIVDLAPLMGATYAENPGLWESASPLNNVPPMPPPFLIIQGTADGTVPPRQAEVMGQALRRRQGTVAVVLVEGGDHEMTNAFAYQETLERMERFITKLLVG
jgi:acetyl esterase/lipase